MAGKLGNIMHRCNVIWRQYLMNSIEEDGFLNFSIYLVCNSFIALNSAAVGGNLLAII
jgi:hypothetical protein